MVEFDLPGRDEYGDLLPYHANQDFIPISKDCEHQWGDHEYEGSRDDPTPFNFCPWCGKDLRKEKENDKE